MARLTIDYGIDLGTTNSEIARLKGTTVEVFRNNLNQEYTPSVVWLDKEARVIVGQRAKDQLERDSENARAEFKLQMGTTEEILFSRSGKRMRPEDLSAEVLKSLKADAKRKTAEDVDAAVICIPAAFEAQQCQATERAARAAGLRVSPLLQEPVAAALAYGFQSRERKAFWLVYDLGGGTFDAAVISLIDGEIQVVNHGGDNHLGGKLIDWDIVDQLLLPAVLRQHSLADFRRGVPRWRGAFAQLKQKAETAKIVLSTDDSTEVVIDSLYKDDRGNAVPFECSIARRDLERLMEPYLARSVNICRRVLEQQRLGVADVARVILVGGPTLSPYLRDRLADAKTGLGIPLEFGVDPMTVVACGAAVFAGGQRLPVDPTGAGALPSAGAAVLEVEYRPIGSDTEPLVGGRVRMGGAASLAGYTIEFINATVRPEWRSGKIGLALDGTFMTNLFAERGRENVFQVEVRTPTGIDVPVSPDRLPYTIGAVLGSSSLVHNVGIALASNEVRWVFEKGQALPAKTRTTVRSVYAMRRGASGEEIKVPIVEGENRRADRNSPVGFLVVPASQVRRDVPAGSEVELEVEFDESRLMRVRAYVPVLDQEFDHVEQLGKQIRSAVELKEEVDGVRARLADLRRRAQETPDAGASRVLRRIDEERMLHNVEGALSAASGDADAADKCQKRLQEFRAALDEVEAALEWPALVASAKEDVEGVGELLDEPSLDVTSEERATYAGAQRDLEVAVRARDADAIRKRRKDLGQLRVALLNRLPEFWIGWLKQLEAQKSSMKDQGKADAYFQQAGRALKSNDVQGLRAAVIQLANLLPDERAREMQAAFGSTVQ